MEREKFYEEYAYVLDFPVYGKEGTKPQYRGGIAQVIGEKRMTLLEVFIKEDVSLIPLTRVSVGKDNRREVLHITGRIGYKELTMAARNELQPAVQKIIMACEQEFVDFFNTSPPISSRMHSLALIPGVGKKYVQIILRERDRGQFKSFAELQERTGLPNPVKLVARRIVEKELAETPRYRLFTRSWA
jgi:putative nucleotide binding protein